MGGGGARVSAMLREAPPPPPNRPQTRLHPPLPGHRRHIAGQLVGGCASRGRRVQLVHCSIVAGDVGREGGRADSRVAAGPLSAPGLHGEAYTSSSARAEGVCWGVLACAPLPTRMVHARLPRATRWTQRGRSHDSLSPRCRNSGWRWDATLRRCSEGCGGVLGRLALVVLACATLRGGSPVWALSQHLALAVPEETGSNVQAKHSWLVRHELQQSPAAGTHGVWVR